MKYPWSFFLPTANLPACPSLLIACQPPKLFISRISPGLSGTPSGLVSVLSKRSSFPRVSMFLKYERSLFWKSSGIFWIIFHISSTVTVWSGSLKLKWAFGSSAPSSFPFGIFIPGWFACTVAPLRSVRAESNASLFPVEAPVGVSVPVEVLEVPPAGASPVSLLTRRPLVLADVDASALCAALRVSLFSTGFVLLVAKFSLFSFSLGVVSGSVEFPGAPLDVSDIRGALLSAARAFPPAKKYNVATDTLKTPTLYFLIENRVCLSLFCKLFISFLLVSSILSRIFYNIYLIYT